MFMRKFNLLIALLAGFSMTTQAQESGFLTDYSLLEDDDMSVMMNARIYEHPDMTAMMKKYEAVMIDQPELIVATDSKYKGLKPDDAVQVAEAMRAALSENLTDHYFVVDKPGPEVMLLRVAASNLYLKKAKRGLLSYTPVGAVVHAAKSASTDEIAKKISLVEITIEAEVLDSMSGEIIGAVTTERGQRKDKAKNQAFEPSSWAELTGLLEMISARLSCRLDNAKLEEAEDHNCVELYPEPVVAEQ